MAEFRRWMVVLLLGWLLAACGSAPLPTPQPAAAAPTAASEAPTAATLVVTETRLPTAPAATTTAPATVEPESAASPTSLPVTFVPPPTMTLATMTPFQPPAAPAVPPTAAPPATLPPTPATVSNSGVGGCDPVVPESAPGVRILEALLNGIEAPFDAPSGTVKLQALYAIDSFQAWTLVVAQFSAPANQEPGVFLLYSTPESTLFDRVVWQGRASSVDEVRQGIRANLPVEAAEMAACVRGVEVFVD